ncbi:MAG: CBS domain-containing protein [Lamprobacter sp.]|uniref:CBS domain-containing protein n=1 Tax=Lamprobacter sp. TaxID=3100796 RepID=UPI002B257FDF|nr:CBS domain-containing protein [Lamprobacter sp.]MEA3641218.1 CBS domain-containing protein [Lamprobacter sp.]
MQLQDVMTPQLEYIGQNQSMIDAARMMREHDIGMLPVIEENQIVGVLTDRDIVTRGLADGIDPETPVSRVMTTGVELRYTDDDVEEAAKLMEQQQIRRLIVVDRTERCVGVVSLGDLATRADQTQLGGEALKEVSQPTH